MIHGVIMNLMACVNLKNQILDVEMMSGLVLMVNVFLLTGSVMVKIGLTVKMDLMKMSKDVVKLIHGVTMNMMAFVDLLVMMMMMMMTMMMSSVISTNGSVMMANALINH